MTVKIIKENQNGRATVIEYNGFRYILDKDHLKRQAKDRKKYYEG